MKLLIKKTPLFIVIILLFGILSSFSNPTNEKETILHNIELLSRGEGSTTPTCVFDGGRCFLNGKIYHGMTIKH